MEVMTALPPVGCIHSLVERSQPLVGCFHRLMALLRGHPRGIHFHLPLFPLGLRTLLLP